MAQEKKFVLPKVDQIALICKNLDNTAAYLTSALGLEPFRIHERNNEVAVGGKKTTANRRLGVAQLGGIQLELIQSLDPGTPYDKFITAKGEVLQHIRFAPVDNLDEIIAYLDTKGFKLAYSGGFKDMRFAYLESAQAKGLILEFVQVGKS